MPAPQVDVLLASDVAAFDFKSDDLAPLVQRFPAIKLRVHGERRGLLDHIGDTDYLLTWEFQEAWYARCPNLKAILTPAAGGDWVTADPTGRVELVHGSFHGRLLGESLLGAMLFMNRRMPAMIDNFRRRQWDRNSQRDCRLLAGQTVLIIGLGRIGIECARILQPLGPRIIGVKRDPSTLPANMSRSPEGLEVRAIEALDDLLPRADHVVLILPGGPGTDRILDGRRLRLCKSGAYLYNFGRGNAVAGDDLIKAGSHLGGVFLDVVDEEPLSPDSPLWSLDNIMITPHSSCVYREYKQGFIDEVISYLSGRV